ncbi:hypothetical protein F4802DRAFT_447489 [Xylaria palmicola]|nr:hypothetical protein F4802DRAFT_447489 [Xylaria palmicola]
MTQTSGVFPKHFRLLLSFLPAAVYLPTSITRHPCQMPQILETSLGYDINRQRDQVPWNSDHLHRSRLEVITALICAILAGIFFTALLLAFMAVSFLIAVLTPIILPIVLTMCIVSDVGIRRMRYVNIHWNMPFLRLPFRITRLRALTAWERAVDMVNIILGDGT